MGRIGLPEIAIILLIALILFGGRRIAGIGKGLGESIKGFRQAVRDDATPGEVQHTEGEQRGRSS